MAWIFSAGLITRSAEHEAITPRMPLPSYMAERRFPEPIALETDVLSTIEQLARELSHVMERRGEVARLLQVALFRADGKVYRLEAAAGQPLRDPERIQRLFIERLTIAGDECDPGFGYDVIWLSVSACERLEPAQSGLAGTHDQSELVHLVDRLSARFGARRVTRLFDSAGKLLEANAERHLKPPAEMARLFRHCPDALAQTGKFLSRCHFSLEELRGTEYPEEKREGFTMPQEALTAFAEAGAERRYPHGMPDKVRYALDEELRLIGELKYAPFFLTVHDIVRFAREKGILC